jgi:hypothetical protein
LFHHRSSSIVAERRYSGRSNPVSADTQSICAQTKAYASLANAPTEVRHTSVVLRDLIAWSSRAWCDDGWMSKVIASGGGRRSAVETARELAVFSVIQSKDQASGRIARHP